MILAFTGHRPQHFDSPATMAAVQDWVYRTIEQEAPEVVISGMALGVDTWAAQAALHLEVPLHAYVPFEGQETRWSRYEQQRYQDLLTHATEIKVISPGGYRPHKFQMRNVAMVDDCDLLAAAHIPKSKGGTTNCVNYAKYVGRDITFCPILRRPS